MPRMYMPKPAISFRGMGFVLAALTMTVAAARVSGQTGTLTNGGELTTRRDGDILHVSVVGPRTGLASLCVGDATQVRILHASAAVGDALYEKADGGWTLKHGFAWRLRDAPSAAVPAAAAEAFFAETGWVANASHAGSPKRDFRIRITDRTQFLGVTYLSVTDPMAVSYWPNTLSDDCKQMKIGQGFLPDVAQFRPETWTRIDR